MPKNNFSTRLKEIRQSRNLSQKSVGEAVGLSMQAINDIEKGRSQTTLERAILLADLFHVSLDYLVGRSAERYELPEKPELFSPESKELISIFESLDELSKGQVLERARIIQEQSPIYRTKR